MTKAQMSQEIARLKGQIAGGASPKKAQHNGLRAVKDESKGKPVFYIALTVDGVEVRHTARKWLAVLQAVTSGILTPDAISRENAKIPVPSANTKAVKAARRDGRAYL